MDKILKSERRTCEGCGTRLFVHNYKSGRVEILEEYEPDINPFGFPYLKKHECKEEGNENRKEK